MCKGHGGMGEMGLLVLSVFGGFDWFFFCLA